MNRECFLERNPAVSFLILAYLLPMPILLLRVFDLPAEPFLLSASWTPNIATVLVLARIVREEEEARRLISGWGKWNVAARWYLAALTIPYWAFALSIVGSSVLITWIYNKSGGSLVLASIFQ